MRHKHRFEEVASLPDPEDLFSVIERPRGLPIDNLTSQFIANIHLHPLDLFVKHDLRVKGYLRYVA